MRRNIRRKPTKGESLFSGIICCAMGLFGLAAVPDFGEFLAFKALWCLMAFGMGIYNFLEAAGKVKMGGYEITDDEPSDALRCAESAEERLTELRKLYDRSLITEEEYETKRREILERL